MGLTDLYERTLRLVERAERRAMLDGIIEQPNGAFRIKRQPPFKVIGQ